MSQSDNSFQDVLHVHVEGVYNLQLQNMVSLPKDRMCEEPPFTYYDVDNFDPFVVKKGNKELKQHGLLYTCLSSRAIHIEAANSLSTDCFIMCLQRFIG